MQRPAPGAQATAPSTHVAVLVALSCLGFLIYSNTLESPFVLDDLQNITANRLIRISELDPAALYRAAFDNYAPRPVANLSFVLNYAIGGYDVRGFHLFNIAVHVANAMLLYLLALRVYRDTLRVTPLRASASRAPVALLAATAAAIFVAHPLQSQAVTYVVQRMTSMAVLFSLVSLLLYLYGRRRPGGRRVAAFSAAVISWLLAMGCKQIAAPLPFLVLLYEWYFEQDLARAWIRRGLPYLAAALVVVGLLGLLFVAGLPLSFERRPFEMDERLFTQFRVVWLYLSLVAFPAPGRLNIAHDVAISHSLLAPPVTLLALAGLLALLGLAVALARRERLLSFCVLFFFATLALESSILPLELVFEHRVYLPMVAVALLAAELLYRPWGTRIAIPAALSAVLVLALATGTVLRNEHWRDAVSLWSDASHKSPGDARARNNLGIALLQRGDLDEAIAAFARSAEADPDYFRARHNLAIALQRRGHLDEAVAAYRAALRVNPGSATAWRDLGTALEQAGETGKAARAYRRAALVQPRFAAAHRELGVALGRLGFNRQALASLATAIRLAPNDFRATSARAQLLADTGDYEASVATFQRAVALRPDNPWVRVQLALTLSALGRVDEAEAALDEASALAPTSPTVRRAVESFRETYGR